MMRRKSLRERKKNSTRGASSHEAGGKLAVQRLESLIVLIYLMFAEGMHSRKQGMSCYECRL
jgi:hypothetical protein